MTKWLLANEAKLKRQMQRSFLARLVIRFLLAVAIASAELDEREAARG